MLANQSRYQIVNSVELNEIFEEKWQKICDEKEFLYLSQPFEKLEQLGIKRFLMKNQENQYTGTAEMVQFTPNGYSILDHYYDFQGDPQFTDYKCTYEIGKLSVDSEHRGGLFLANIIFLMIDVWEQHGINRFVSVTESDLFHTLKKGGFTIQQVKEQVTYKGNTFVPMSFYMPNLLEDVKRVKWLKRLNRFNQAQKEKTVLS